MFLANKYTRWYNNIINNANNRVLTRDIYSERHHIIPYCFYVNNRSKGARPGWILGNPNSAINIVKLTAKEHFICHWLLTKMTTGEIQHKMLHALGSMRRGRVLSGGQYNKVKEVKSQLRRGTKTPKHITDKAVDTRRRNNSYQCSPESNAKRSQALKGRSLPESQKLLLKEIKTGIKLSEDAISKRTESRKKNGVNHNIGGLTLGWALNQQRIKNGTHQFLGAQNPSHKRLAEGTHNFTQVHVCPHCNKEGKGPQMRRYHFDNCKSKS